MKYSHNGWTSIRGQVNFINGISARLSLLPEILLINSNPIIPKLHHNFNEFLRNTRHHVALYRTSREGTYAFYNIKDLKLAHFNRLA